MGAPTISYAYKVGLKREIVQATRDAFSTWPDEQYRGKVAVVNEWPLSEIKYPMVVLHFQENSIQNIGVGHFEIDYDADGSAFKLMHWVFEGVLTFTVYANDPLDRDKLAVGILNMFAFGREIPEFKHFMDELVDDDFIALQVNTDKIIPGGDNTVTPPWGNPDDNIFSTSYGVEILGEFFTDPRTSDLVRIDKIIARPYIQGHLMPNWDDTHLYPQFDLYPEPTLYPED
jgi:hypothetical protein